MNNIPQYIPFVAAILGIAYPILLQVIARLEEKYGTMSIVEIFNSELEKRSFIVLLISSLFSILIWTFNLPPLFSVNNSTIQWIINNSAALLVIITSVAMITSFFFYTKKIIVYYTTPKLLDHLFKRHRNKIANQESLDFKIISDILINLYRKNEKTHALTISRFIYDEFRFYREKNEGKAIEYPDLYYDLVYSISQELSTSKNTLYPYLGVRTIGGIWLLGELQHSIISEKTYRYLWNIVIIAAEDNLEDLIASNWEFAFRYYQNSLRKIEYEYDDEGQKTNVEAYQSRVIERKRFNEFYTAFGGLMLYTKRYNSVFNMFNYTTSTPPVYELLPSNMNEIFERFFTFRDPYYRNFPFISSTYNFPRLSGLNADGIIKKWICQYIALLFVRQYFTIINYTFQKPLDFPSIPKSQQEKNNWINDLDYFSRLVENVLSNKELLTTLGYERLTREWCEENDKIYPIDFVKQLKDKVQEEFDKAKVEQKISENKFNKFIESTKSILTKSFDSVASITNEKIEKVEYANWYYSGTKMIFEKSSFAENQEADHLNYDSFVAGQVASDFKLALSQTAFTKKTKSYLIKSTELFQAVDKVIKDDKSYVILNFGIHIPFYISSFKIKGLKEDSYNKTPIINLAPYYRELIGESLYVLKQDDLPRILFNTVDDKIIDKYQLQRLNDKYNFYGNVVDLNDNPDLVNELVEQYPDEQVKESVLVCVILNAVIKWKKEMNMTQIRLFSEFKNNGLPNEIDEIK
ncbi:hypothetical protein [Marinifilum sp. D737]|uniref:hypothetical protein n=1 Tax=Marinifilum sp. D737 TaxID=2969628 RepID=UPI002273DF51|nr:hypothetical protein [Marinifilum sp. D737]MCY1636704.1 hypothetical protein [Marinifilum sp. D737]